LLQKFAGTNVTALLHVTENLKVTPYYRVIRMSFSVLYRFVQISLQSAVPINPVQRSLGEILTEVIIDISIPNKIGS